jgi:hypothetical protein
MHLLTSGLGIRHRQSQPRDWLRQLLFQTTTGVPTIGTPARIPVLFSLRLRLHGDERRPQRCRTGLRNSAINSGVSTIHHGLWGLA